MSDKSTAAGGAGAGAGRTEAYASALFEIAQAEGALEAVESELYTVARTLEASDELRNTLTDARIPAVRRQSIVEELLGERSHPTTMAIVSFVVGAGRGKDLPDIIQKLVERSTSERGQEVAEVRSAMPLDESQRERLAEALGKATGKKVSVKVVVDPAVLGGLVARVGDTVIDGSVRHRLAQLKAAL